VFGAAPELVTDEMRRSAKAINFGLITASASDWRSN
jgi:DNA polymerase I-like protein with 3'-5' exonuclease and polymerase domains